MNCKAELHLWSSSKASALPLQELIICYRMLMALAFSCFLNFPSPVFIEHPLLWFRPGPRLQFFIFAKTAASLPVQCSTT